MTEWSKRSLNEACVILNGGTPKTKVKEYWGGDIQWLTPKDMGQVDEPRIKSTSRTITKLGLEKSSAKLIRENSVILSTRAPIGHLVINEVPMTTNQGCRGLVPSDELDVQFLYYFLLSNVDLLNSLGTGTTFKELSSRNLGSVEIPLPPLPEQKRIVAILDQAFEAIDQAQANIERNIKNAEELFQSKLNEVFGQSGEGWEEKTLIELTDKIGSGATPRGGQASYKDSGISLIRSMNVHDEGFRKKKLAFIDEEQAAKLNNVTVENGDVLLNITGASVARCCVMESEILPARVNQHVSIIRPKKGRINSQFLHYALTCQENKKKLLGIGEQGATRQAITKAQIQTFKISFPKSIEAQERIIIEINETRKMTGRIVDILSQKIASTEELKKSILQKAFSGELTEKEVVV